jgi:DNA-directed RNA polymerase specialized sigma24 family protein
VSRVTFGEAKQKVNKMRLERAYENYTLNPIKHGATLFQEVFAFAFKKLRWIEIENPQTETIQTAEDYAQEVAKDVWKTLATFRPNNFHAWLSKIVNNTKNDFISEMDDQKKNKVGVMVIMDDDDGGESEEVENPLLHASSGYGQFLNIPSSVTGIDLNICKMLLTQVRGKNGNHRGRTYGEVARALNMTEEAVDMRLKKLRKRLVAEKNEERAKNLNTPMEAKRQQRERADAELAKIRADKAKAIAAATELEQREVVSQ